MDNVVIMKDSLNKAVFELYYWQVGDGTNFHAMLFDLIQKADMQNLVRLQKAFPAEVQAWKMWLAATDIAGFFEAHGVTLPESQGGKS